MPAAAREIHLCERVSESLDGRKHRNGGTENHIINDSRGRAREENNLLYISRERQSVAAVFAAQLSSFKVISMPIVDM